MTPLLPFIDDHQVRVSASTGAVWRALTVRLIGPRRAGAEAFALLVGAEPRRATGASLTEGATLPGFAVASVEPGVRVQLTGRHRFSRYALTFTLAAQPDGTMLNARTHAAFLGLHGRIYRQLVIGSGAHRILVTRLLRAVRRQAEDA